MKPDTDESKSLAPQQRLILQKPTLSTALRICLETCDLRSLVALTIDVCKVNVQHHYLGFHP